MVEPDATEPLVAPREETETVPLVLFSRQKEALDVISKQAGRSRSDVARELLDRTLNGDEAA